MGGHFLSGSSMMCHYHYGQLIESDTFSDYDFGTEKNKKMYGQKYPPQINLQPVATIEVPIAIFVGD